MRTLPAILTALAAATTASASAPPDYDFQWATVGAVNNPAYSGENINGYPLGRGSVSYEYRMSKVELTAGQWLEFVNTYTAFNDPFAFGHQSEGGGIERAIGGPLRWVLANGPDAANRPMARLS